MTEKVEQKKKYKVSIVQSEKNIKDLFTITSIPVLIASLCCLSPVILVALGLASVSFASSLADTLYGTYKWIFRGIGLLALVIAFVYYLRKQAGVCTLDDAIKRRNEIINKLALVLITGVLGYVFFLYVVVHYVGVFLQIWS